MGSLRIPMTTLPNLNHRGAALWAAFGEDKERDNRFLAKSRTGTGERGTGDQEGRGVAGGLIAPLCRLTELFRIKFLPRIRWDPSLLATSHYQSPSLRLYLLLKLASARNGYLEPNKNRPFNTQCC